MRAASTPQFFTRKTRALNRMSGGRDFNSELLAILEKLRVVKNPSEIPGLVNEIKALPFPASIDENSQEAFSLLMTIHTMMISDVGVYETIPEKIARLRLTGPAYAELSNRLATINPKLKELVGVVKYVTKIQIIQATAKERDAEEKKAKAEAEAQLFAEAMLADSVKGGGRRRRRRGNSKKARSSKKRATRKSKD